MHPGSMDGCVCLYLKDGETREKTLFASALAEFYSPIENQRYILENQKLITGINRYFAVPEVLSRKKEDA